MTGPERKLAELAPRKRDHDSILLIAADADEAARVLGELGSVTEERFHVEWVTELSSGIERLRDGGVQAVVLDLNLSGGQGAEPVQRPMQRDRRDQASAASPQPTEHEASRPGGQDRQGHPGQHPDDPAAEQPAETDVAARQPQRRGDMPEAEQQRAH